MDKIMYSLVSEPGGADGMDSKAKGGNVLHCSFDKSVIEKKKGSDSRYRIEKEVVDTDELRKQVKAKLTPAEMLVVELKKENATR